MREQLTQDEYELLVELSIRDRPLTPGNCAAATALRLGGLASRDEGGALRLTRAGRSLAAAEGLPLSPTPEADSTAGDWA